MGDQAAAYRFARNLPARSIGGTKVTDPQHVHLSYGFPATDLLPVEELQAAAEKALKWDRADALHYSGAKGPARVRDWVLARSRKFGIHAGAENFIPTFGAIQGIDLTARILLNPGDEAWVEAPTFFNGLQAFRAAGAVIRSIPVDEQGLQVELLEAALKQAAERNEPIPKLLYCMPNYHNPTGVSLSLERRQRLAELAVAYNFLILEDDAYAELNISGETLPAIYSFAPSRSSTSVRSRRRWVLGCASAGQLPHRRSFRIWRRCRWEASSILLPKRWSANCCSIMGSMSRLKS